MSRMESWISRHWLAVLNGGALLMVLLPALAPVLAWAGLTGPARWLYYGYSWLCHQYADRSFFLFGPRLSYSYQELLMHMPQGNPWSSLASFTGNAEIGYKVAWSDRMVAMSLGLLAGGLVYAMLRRYMTALDGHLMLFASLPMALDGGTHLISDLAGFGRGFRHTNAWLVTLSRGAFASTFYAGNALGSFNSWMRLLTGFIFCFALAWCIYPRMSESAQ